MPSSGESSLCACYLTDRQVKAKSGYHKGEQSHAEDLDVAEGFNSTPVVAPLIVRSQFSYLQWTKVSSFRYLNDVDSRRLWFASLVAAVVIFIQCAQTMAYLGRTVETVAPLVYYGLHHRSSSPSYLTQTFPKKTLTIIYFFVFYRIRGVLAFGSAEREVPG